MGRSLEQMRRDWDRRAMDDTLYWVYTVHGRRYGTPGFYYEDGARHGRKMVAPRLEDWGQNPEGKTLLEIGCGIGRLFPGFSQLGFSRIIGVDVSPEMVSRGREWCPIRDAEFLLVDGEWLTGVESGSVDYVFSYNVLGHLPSKSILRHNFEEIARVLKTGGYIQAHFRGWHALKRRIARRIPDLFLPAVTYVYRTATMRQFRGVSRPTAADPGHRQTLEFGVAVSPERVSKKIQSLGFSGVKVERDTDYADGSRYWATGRKIGKG